MNQAKFGLLESWHLSWLSGWCLSMFASCIHSTTYPTYPLLILSLLAGNVKPCKTIGFQQKFWVPRPEVKTLTHSQAFFSLAFIASMQSFQQQSQILHLFATFLYTHFWYIRPTATTATTVTTATTAALGSTIFCHKWVE